MEANYLFCGLYMVFTYETSFLSKKTLIPVILELGYGERFSIFRYSLRFDCMGFKERTVLKKSVLRTVKSITKFQRRKYYFVRALESPRN